MYSFVTKSDLKMPRCLCLSVLGAAQKRLRGEFGIHCELTPVGSAYHNLVTRNGAKPFDLDYDFLFQYDKVNAEKLKGILMLVLDDEAIQRGFSHGQDSKSAIKYNHWTCGSIDFSLDIGIIIYRDGTGYRLIHDKERNRFLLNETVHFAKLKLQQEAIKANCLGTALREVYLDMKNAYLRQGDRDHTSFVVYVEAVNRVWQSIPEEARKDV